MDVKAIRQTQSLNVMSLDELMGNLETIELEMHEDLRRKKQHVILVEKEKQCVKDSAGTCCAFPTFHSVDGDSDSDVDPREMLIIVEEKFQESLRVNKKKCLENDSLKRELAESKRDVEQLIKELQRYKDPREMLIIVEEKFQESLRVNKKKCLENDSLKRELAESKRDVEQLIKELQRYKGKVTAEDDREDDREDDTEDDTEVDTAEELAMLQRKWVELVQANQKTVLENHHLVAERNGLKESISELEKKIEDLEGQQSDLKLQALEKSVVELLGSITAEVTLGGDGQFVPNHLANERCRFRLPPSVVCDLGGERLSLPRLNVICVVNMLNGP
ncbi:unnamed protein product [Cuscuta campestris]|uniref:Uncharacterized protein n=1 Tax=Cuscuta campestris TaxID=132261 RepID=A0A484MDI8_9ASTE|nr:unnamed protein product [Cuscuta campestris]